jgi:Na+-translocating ferredoxin:NAD+ oxidoreductase RnfE subunit
MAKSSSNGIGLGTVLFIVFLVLKLTGHIDWSWWWVTSPLWIPLAIIIIALLVIGVFVVIAKRARL